MGCLKITYPSIETSLKVVHKSFIFNRKSCAGEYRYGFNGMEKDDEVKGSGNSLDFGARIYDPRVGRWLSLDPAASEFPEVSAYNYTLNNPIIYSDPDGEKPLLVITNEQTGYTHTKIYGASSGKKVMVVPTYKMIVYDVADNGTKKVMGTFNVTRDGWFNQGPSGNGSDLYVNRTTEPVGAEITVSAKSTIDYGKTFGAYVLESVDAVPTPLDWNTYTFDLPVSDKVVRSDPSKATSVMIHIGGIYETPSGNCSVGGTYGCFGVIDPSQISSTAAEAEAKAAEALSILNNPTMSPTMQKTSNSEQNAVVNAVNNAVSRGNARGESNSDQKSVTIKKRDNVERTKKIPR